MRWTPPAWAGFRGLSTTCAGSASHTEVKPITDEYQLCFRCHGDSTGAPPALTARQIEQTNTRLEFQTGNPSFHPVAGPGANPDVPSLIAPLTTGATIECGDCHHDKDGKPIRGLKIGYDVQNCIDCHSKASKAKAPKGKKMSKPRQLPTDGCKEIGYRPKDANEPYVARSPFP